MASAGAGGSQATSLLPANIKLEFSHGLDPLQTYINELVRQMLRFPHGKLDDGIDVLSLMGRALDTTRAAHLHTHVPDKVIRPYTPEWVELDDSDPKERSKYRL